MKRGKYLPLCIHCGAPCVGGQTDPAKRSAHFECQKVQTSAHFTDDGEIE